MGVGCEVDDADDATSVGVGGGTAFGGITGLGARLGDAAGSGEGEETGLRLGEATGVGTVLLSVADEFWELGELAGSAATPDKVVAHHMKTTNNTCRRIRQSRLVISRYEEVFKRQFLRFG